MPEKSQAAAIASFSWALRLVITASKTAAAGVARQEGEEVRPVDPLEGGPAGLDAVEQVVRGPRVPRLAHQQDVVADGVGGVAPQRFRLRCEAETSVLALGEDPDAGQRAQDAVQGRGVHSGSRRQCRSIQRALLEEVR